MSDNVIDDRYLDYIGTPQDVQIGTGEGGFRASSIPQDWSGLVTEEVIANRYGLTTGSDLYQIVQDLLDNVNIGKVRVLEGDYLLSARIIIPAGKELILSGNNNSEFLTPAEASSKVFTKIVPIFDNDYCFELMDRSTLRNGFIDCSSMTIGGGALIDFSTNFLSRLNILGTVFYGGNKWNLNAILLNGDRTVGTTPGYGYFFVFDCGIDAFGKGVYLKRQDTYNTLGSGVNDMAWINGITVKGNMRGCQRYVYFDTVTSLHAGGSSTLQFRMQGNTVPDPVIPAIEFAGEGMVVNSIFHDIGTGADGRQQQRLKIRSGALNTYIIRGSGRYQTHISDAGTNTVYASDINDRAVYGAISTIDGAVAVSDGWFTRTFTNVTINFRVLLAVSTVYTDIYTMPFTATNQTRCTCISDDGLPITVKVLGNKLSVINNNGTSKNLNLQITFPIIT